MEQGGAAWLEKIAGDYSAEIASYEPWLKNMAQIVAPVITNRLKHYTGSTIYGWTYIRKSHKKIQNR